ncbi:S1 RNA-binding domain-containing protein [Candidatus Margulisiibacteriota bacterium]
MPIEIGSDVEGKVTGITKFGAFIELPEKAVGLVHISQVSNTFVTDINQHIKVGDIVKVKVLGTNKNNKFDLSMKQVGKSGEVKQSYRPRVEKKNGPATFEDKITIFLKQSDERLLDLKKNTEAKQGVRKRKPKVKQ